LRSTIQLRAISGGRRDLADECQRRVGDRALGTAPATGAVFRALAENPSLVAPKSDDGELSRRLVAPKLDEGGNLQSPVWRHLVQMWTRTGKNLPSEELFIYSWATVFQPMSGYRPS